MTFKPGDRIQVTEPKTWLYLKGTYMGLNDDGHFHRIRFDGQPASYTDDVWMIDSDIELI